MIVKATCTFDNRVANPLEVIDISGVVLVQLWCNWHGKDGYCALDGQNVVLSIERMDGIFPMERMFSSPVQFEVRRLS